MLECILLGMRYILAIDQGTTSTRAIVFDQKGRAVAMDQREHDQILPAPGWVEHDALQILARTESVVVGALSEAGIRSDALAAVGITNQRETTVVWDHKTGKPIANALVWQDTRTDNLCTQYCERIGQDALREKTGLPISTYFSALKIRWLLEHVPGAKAAAARGDLLWGTMDSWLMWHLTGAHVTDVTNASRTLLMDLRTLTWHDELLNLFDLPRQMFPRIVSSSEFIAPGRGILKNVPFSAILGDQQAALFGHLCFYPGNVKCTYGTGGFLLMNSGVSPCSSSHGLLTTVAYRLGQQPAHYALEGSVAIAGAAVQWLRDNLGIIAHSCDIEPLAASVPDNGGVYFVPAFNGLFAPHWQPNARGVISGLTRFSNKGHLARAALEATAYQTNDILNAMQLDTGLPMQSLRVDGGMVQNKLLLQFQADISNVNIIRPGTVETTALGAAFAAGLAVEYWKSLEDLPKVSADDTLFEPKMVDTERSSLLNRWRAALLRAVTAPS